MQIFSLHWMMQNIRLFDVNEVLRASQRHLKANVLYHPVQAKNMHFNPYILNNKKRNTPLKTAPLSGISQVTGQFGLYRCKGMSVTAALHIFCSQVSKMCERKLVMNQV